MITVIIIFCVFAAGVLIFEGSTTLSAWRCAAMLLVAVVFVMLAILLAAGIDVVASLGLLRAT